MSNFKHLHVHTSQGPAGSLIRESQHVFNYGTQDPSCEVSLTMPLTSKSYAANILPGVLRQNLPEGFLLDWIRQHFGKTMKMDSFNLLAITGKEMIGRVRCRNDSRTAHPVTRGESLHELLTWRGTEDLFAYLSEKYAASSGIAGVQPKVLIERKSDHGIVEKSAIKDSGLIVKAAGIDYDGLAENEYHCMSIARLAGLQVPEFWLSENKSLFIVERFDRTAQGDYLGFEDMTALTGRQNEEKYSASYEITANVVATFASPQYVAASLDELFKSVVLSVILRNGDAHLKNFGLLYTTPQTDDVRLSPLFDIVNTTAYIPKDTLALKMNKTKAWPDRNALIHFGRMHCQVAQPQEVIDHIAEVAHAYVPAIEPGEIWDKIKIEIERGVRSVGKGILFGSL